MKLVGRIPVESLDEDRLTNIERKLVVRVAEAGPPPVRAPRRVLALAAATLAVAVAAIVGWKLHVPPIAAPAPEAAAVALREGVLDIGDATIASERGTDFTVTRPNGGVLVDMKHGTVELEVAKRHGRPPLVVRAGDTDVEVVGTHFSVAWDGHGEPLVRVTEGTVRVKHQQKQELVAHGHQWTASQGVIALVEHHEEPVVVATNLHPHTQLIPEAQHPQAPKRVEPPHPVVVDEAARQRAIIAADPYVELKLAIRRQPIAFAPAIDDKSEAAARVGELKKIAYSPQSVGEDAGAALYRMAVLLDQPLHQDDEALRTLEMYLRRFSSGKEHAAALWLRVRILCGRTIDDSCRKAAYSYQHEVPTGDAAEVAIRITNSQ